MVIVALGRVTSLVATFFVSTCPGRAGVMLTLVKAGTSAIALISLTARLIL